MSSSSCEVAESTRQPLLVLLRHGQSTWNLENKFTGWCDIPLTSEGEEEAVEAGGILATVKH